MPGTFQRLEVGTSWGSILIRMQDQRVVECTLPRLEKQPGTPFRILHAETDPVSQFVVSVFEGRPKKCPALGKLIGTDFQSLVWASISAIPAGHPTSYKELAASIGRPSACRAVANACGKNPVPLFIPCHRVVGANGNIGGYSPGTVWKHLLLSSESR